jgi:hypothetical protein
MKSIFTLAPFLFSLLSFSQNNEVKKYYSTHNQILDNFARSQDTSKYLDEMSAFIQLNGKKYTRLTHHYKFTDFCLEQKNYDLAKLIVESQLKYNITTHFRLKDTAARNSSRQSEFYNSPEILDVINNSNKEYKDLMGQVSLFKSIQLNSLMEVDQFGRTVIYEPSIDTLSNVRSDIIKFTDSTNLIRIYEYIEEFGFPEVEEVGYFTDFMIMWHTYCRPCRNTYTLPNGQWYYYYLDSVYFEAVLDGKVSNTYYAYLKDKSFTEQWIESYPECSWKGQKYVTWFQGKKDHPLYDVQNIDKHRAEIYLPPYWVDAVLNGWEIPDDYPVPDNMILKY